MQTDEIRSTLATLQVALNHLSLTENPSDWTDTNEGITARSEAATLARLRTAEAALRLAGALLSGDDPPVAGALQHVEDVLNRQIRNWRKTGRGWFEERTESRMRKPRGKGAKQSEDTQPTLKTYGPYYYFRWRDSSGRMQSEYYGKQRPAEMDRASAFPTMIVDQE